MRLYFLFFTTLWTAGCMTTPETPNSKELIAKEKIQYNKSEALQAQDNYIKLQRQRNRE